MARAAFVKNYLYMYSPTWPGPRAPTHIFSGGEAVIGSYFIPRKIPISEFMYPKKPSFLAYPKKSHGNIL